MCTNTFISPHLQTVNSQLLEKRQLWISCTSLFLCLLLSGFLPCSQRLPFHMEQRVKPDYTRLRGAPARSELREGHYITTAQTFCAANKNKIHFYQRVIFTRKCIQLRPKSIQHTRLLRMKHDQFFQILVILEHFLIYLMNLTYITIKYK